MASTDSQKGVKVAVVYTEGAGPSRSKAGADAVKASLERHGHRITRTVPVGGDIHDVQRALREAIEDKDVQAIVIIGGTGLSKSDVTIEAVGPFEEKSLEGFGEAVRAISEEVLGPERILVRCTAFVSEAKVVYCLPDADKVARLAAERLVGPTLSKAVRDAAA